MPGKPEQSKIFQLITAKDEDDRMPHPEPREGPSQRITGVVVNSGMSIPRRDRHRFRAILTNVKKNGLDKEARGRKDFAAYLLGFAAYVKMVQPDLGKKWVAEVKALTKKP